MKEDKASWGSFFRWLKGRGLEGVQLIVGDTWVGILEAVGAVYPEAKYQRCVVHFYRDVFSCVLRTKGKLVAKCSLFMHRKAEPPSRRMHEMWLRPCVRLSCPRRPKRLRMGWRKCWHTWISL